MATHHKYPEEVQRDARSRALYAWQREILRLAREHGRLAVLGASVVLKDRANDAKTAS